jgi:hypothetical protein
MSPSLIVKEIKGIRSPVNIGLLFLVRASTERGKKK